MYLELGSNLHPFISAKQPQQHSVSLNLRRVGGVGVASVPGSPARELSRLVQLQRDRLQALESRLLGCEAEMQDWDDSAGEADQVSQTAGLPAPRPAGSAGFFFPLKVSPFLICEGGNLEEEVLLLEQLARRNHKEMEEEEFWQNELLIEQESEQQLRVKLAELQSCVRDCEAKLEQYLAHIEVGVAPALTGSGHELQCITQHLSHHAEDGGRCGAGAAGGGAGAGGQRGGGTNVLAEATHIGRLSARS